MLGKTAVMGPALRTEVERQLLADLSYYGCNIGVAIDWSDAVQEGHCTVAMDGNLEDLSGLAVRNTNGEAVAKGWMDFVHSGEPNPLFVFWLFLDIRKDGQWVRVKDTPTIPEHVWARLPDETKQLCQRQDVYDARWADDPLVKAWCPRKHG